MSSAHAVHAVTPAPQPRPTLSLKRRAAPTPPAPEPSKWSISKALWNRAHAAYALGRDKPPTRSETALWLRSIVLGAITARERTAGAERQNLTIVAPAGAGDRYAGVATADGYESVSSWACDVLEKAAAEAGNAQT